MIKNTTGYFLYLIIFFATVTLIVEMAGRIWIHMKYGVEGKSYGLWKHDPELGSTHRKNAYNMLTSTNNWGFRNREDVIEPKPKDSLRIIAFGGSTTFGYNLKDDQTFTYRLQNKLRAVKGWKDTQVLNAGRIAVGAGYNLKLMLRLVPKLKPDYVIIYEGVNEILDFWSITQIEGLSFDDLKGKYGYLPQKGSDKWHLQNTIIGRLIHYYVINYFNNSDNFHQVQVKQQISDLDPWVLNNFEWVLNQMIDFLKAQGVTPL